MKFIIFLVILMFFVGTSNAQIFSSTDKNGTICFSDDPVSAIFKPEEMSFLKENMDWIIQNLLKSNQSGITFGSPSSILLQREPFPVFPRGNVILRPPFLIAPELPKGAIPPTIPDTKK